jgi:SAM-dependent methyltransferase
VALADEQQAVGVATRALMARGADVVAVDRGPEVLRRATTRTRDLNAAVADGAALPVRSASVDLLCFARAWHWLNESSRVREAHRVLRAGGRWAGWWSHARADDEDWFDRYWASIERSCRGTHRRQRDIDWGATVATSGQFAVSERVVVPWVREISVDEWVTDQASHSYVAALAPSPRADLLAELRAILDARFQGGAMSVRYETWLWIATHI